MKTKTCVGVFLGALIVACGGSDTVTLDGGDDTGTGNDGAPTNDGSPTSDSAPSDGAPGDTGPTDSGPTLDSGNFNPANVNGLVLWLESNVASSITQNNGRITQWADQTSHHNDAKGSTNTATRNPTLKSGQINTLDAVHFNKGQTNTTGNMLVIADNADKSLQWGTGDFFVAIVGEFDNDPKDNGGTNFAVGNFFSKNVATSQTTFSGVAFYGNIPGATSQIASSAGLLFMTANTSLTDLTYSLTPYNDNNPHVFGMRRQGSKLDLYVDGTSVNSSTPLTNIDVSNANIPVRIGCDGDANAVRLDGDIGEIYAVAGTLSANDQTSIQAYLKNKWKTP